MAIETLKADIRGMHCAACSARIERVVGNMAGVTSCSVNLATEKAKIEYDASTISATDIAEAINGLGFTAVAAGEAADLAQERLSPQAQLATMQRGLVAMFVPALLIVVLAMGHMAGLQLPAAISPDFEPLRYGAVQLLLLAPVVWLGRDFYLSGIPSLLRGGPNMDSLIAMGTGAAIIYSLWNLAEIGMGIDPAGKAHDLYFESAAMLLALVSLGKFLEARSKARTTDAIRELMALAPETAILLVDGETKEIPVAEIAAGNRLLIRPGERIPVDGKVVDGHSEVDESMLTGESMPVSKAKNDTLYGGTFNASGALVMEVEKTGGDTMLARIINLVQEAQGSKAPIARLADRISLYFVPAVMILALLAGLAWYFAGDASFTFSLRIFIAVLVIACPCAMGLATPTSIMVGTGRGAQLGVLVKNGEVLELAQKITTVVFDKTGTLTVGRPAVTDIVVFGGLFEHDIVQLAATAESRSEHPLARAVIEEARKKNLSSLAPVSFTAVPGQGIETEVHFQGRRHIVLVGNRVFMEARQVEGVTGEVAERVTGFADEGKTVLFFAIDNHLEALLAIADPLKDEARPAIAALKRMGLKLVMLTGDNGRTARAVAARAGIDDFIADVLPDEKEQQVQQLQARGEVVAMVGDGINDAPALARADVGIAMGTGIDVAVESAGIVLMNGHLSGVQRAISLSRATMRNIRQNLFWAFAYNVIGIPVAAGVLVIFGGPALNPMIGGAAMALSSVSVVSNALRLRWFRPEK